jgi:two-component system chemotaxis sensor kinase CheA
MNPLLARFIPEARDLLQAAAGALLGLEKTPDDAAAINNLFRSVHTLKGSSGLFDVPALTRLVHVAEDLLGAVRAGRTGLTSERVDVLLDCLDQAGFWIDALERTESLPADADEATRALLARLRASFATAGDDDADAPGPAQAAEAPAADWLHLLPGSDLAAARERAEAGQTVLAIRYRPDEGCFYRGEDPLNLFRCLPGLLALHIAQVAPWPEAGDFDPYRCNLAFHALAAAPRAEAEHLFRYVADEVDIATLPAAAPATIALDGVDRPGPDDGGAPAAMDALRARILAEQRRILALPGDSEQAARRVAAVAGVLHNLIAGGSLNLRAEAVEAAVAHATATGTATDLLALLDGIRQAEAAALVADATTDTPAGPLQPPPTAPMKGAEKEDGGEARPAVRMLKVDQAKVDALMNLIGELIVSKNALPFLARRAEQVHGCREMSREIKDQYAVIDRLAQEMQGAIMQVRLLPVSEVFDRFPRLVRDLARKLGKQIGLVVEGEDTAADKAIIEALGDPLLHIVRNAIDHGVELPAARLAAGKAEHAVLRLRARQESDQVVIEVSDDGAGIDPARIRDAAVAKGVLDAARAAALSDQDAVNLIFHPGFSTAREISDLSGRGVGMDVVRTTIERLGGHVTVASRVGEGTQVRLSLPLSMAITRVMMVEAGGTPFGIPMDVIAETVRVEQARIRMLKRAETFVLREAIVPLVRLAERLGMAQQPREPEAAEAVLVVRLGGNPVGLVVDAFREGMDVILKPLDGVLAGLRGYAGTALLGDGRVLLVLNPKELL